MNTEKIKIKVKENKIIDEFGYISQPFDDIEFIIESCKIVTLLISNGTDTSHLLRKVCEIDGNAKTNDKRIIIPSKPSSFPWLNVQENIVFNLESFDKDKVSNVIKFVGLSGYEDHYPNNKSTGFRFRISLARAIIHNPELIVINTPFSNLSKKRKMEFYSLIRKTKSQYGISILFSTDSITEAVRVSDKVIILENSHLQITSHKTILVDEENRIDDSFLIDINDYFSNEELKFL